MADGTIKILTELSTDGLKSGLKVAGKAVTAASAALGALGVAAIKVGSDFEAGMSKVAAISGATATEMDTLTEKAKEMGAKTKFSASESAAAFEYMAMAGWKTEDMLAGIEGIMDLAAASGEDLALTSDIVTDALTAFGLTAADSSHFADVLAKASASANTNVAMMGETFKYVGPVAGALGYSVEDMSVAIGLMANSGIKGSQAGTALRATLSRLAKPTKQTATAMDALGISLTNQDGTMKSFSEVMGDMRTGFAGLTEAEQANMAAALGGQEAMSGLLAIVNASDADFAALTNEINNADGAAKSMAETMQDNLQGAVEEFKGAAETLGIEVYESVSEPLKNLAKEGTAAVEDLISAFKDGGFEGLAGAVGGLLSDIVEKIADSAPELVKAAATMVKGLLQGFQKNAAKIAKGAAEAASEYVRGLLSILPELLKTGAKMISELMKGMAKEIPNIAKSAVQTVKEFCLALGENIPVIIEAAIELMQGLVDGILQAVPEIIAALPIIIQAILDGLLDAIPLIMDGALALFMGIVDAIPMIVSELVAALPLIIDSIVNFLGDSIPQLVTGAVNLFMGILAAIPQIVTELVNAMPQIISAIVTGLINGVGEVVKAAIQLFIPISDESKKIDEAFRDNCDSVAEFAKALENTEPQVAEYNSLLSDTGKTVGELDTAINTTETAITTILQEAFSTQEGLRQDDLANIRAYLDDLNALQAEKLGIYRDQQLGILKQLQLERGNLTAEEAAQHNANVQAALDESNRIVDEAYTQQLAIIENTHKAAGTLNTDAYYSELEASKKNHDDLIAENKAFADAALVVVADSATAWVKEDKEKWSDLADLASKFSTENDNWFQSYIKNNAGSIAELTNSYDPLKQAYTELADENAAAFLSMITTTKKESGVISTENRELASAILDSYDNLPAGMTDIAKDSLLGLIAGIQDEIPGLSDAANMTADEIVDVLRDVLDIHSPSRVMEQIGYDTMSGLNNGIEDKKGDVLNTMTGVGRAMCDGMKRGMESQVNSLLSEARWIADRVTREFKTRLDIHSPSKVTEKIGDDTGAGLVVGLAKKERDVRKTASGLADTMISATQNAASLPMLFRNAQNSVYRMLSSAPAAAAHTVDAHGGFGFAGANGAPVVNITNHIESPVPITVADGVRAANRQTADALFRLGVKI